MAKQFYDPLISLLTTYEANPGSQQALYDSVEAFVMKNLKTLAGDDSNTKTSASKRNADTYSTVEMYAVVNDITSSNSCFEKISISRFIQAILFKEHIRTTAKLSSCTLKQFDEILYYYSNRLSGTEYKNHQQDFTEVFYKAYLAMDKESQGMVEKYLNDENITYRLKKLMRTALTQVQQHLAGTRPVIDTILKDLVTTKTPAKEEAKPAPAKTTKTSAKKTAVKQPAVQTPPKDKEPAQQTPIFPSGVAVGIDHKGRRISIVEVMRSIRDAVSYDFTREMFDQLSDEDKQKHPFVVVVTEAAEGNTLAISLIKEALYNHLMDTVGRSIAKEMQKPVDPLRQELDTLREQVKGLRGTFESLFTALDGIESKLSGSKK